MLRSKLERILERQRAEGQFFSGEGLLKRLEHHIGKLDLIFLDMEMGELAGTEIARRLRSANPGLHLVFVTGYATVYLADTWQSGCGTPWWVSLLAWTRRREPILAGIGLGEPDFLKIWRNFFSRDDCSSSQRSR